MTSVEMTEHRAKLALAMGWKTFQENNQGPWYWQEPGSKSYSSDFNFCPFTDANDDYAVLEWVRAIEEEGLDREMFHMKFSTELCGLKSMYDYRVGDYARAALTVVNRPSPESSDE